MMIIILIHEFYISDSNRAASNLMSNSSFQIKVWAIRLTFIMDKIASYCWKELTALSCIYIYMCAYVYIYMYVSTTLLLSIAMTDPHFLRMESVFSLLNAVWSCSSYDTLVTSNSISNFIALKIMSAIVCLITPQVSNIFFLPLGVKWKSSSSAS